MSTAGHRVSGGVGVSEQSMKWAFGSFMMGALPRFLGDNTLCLGPFFDKVDEFNGRHFSNIFFFEAFRSDKFLL